MAAAVAAMIATNAAAHLVAPGLLPVDWPLVVAVSAIAPLVLWRVHRLADHAGATREQPLVPVVNTAPPAAVAVVDEGTDTPGKEAGTPDVMVTAEQPVAEHRAVTAPQASPLVICGDGQVYALAVPAADTGDEVNTGAPDEVAVEPVARLATAQAREVIEACWVNGVSIRETARRATRSPAYVAKVFAKLDEGGGPTAPVPGSSPSRAGSGRVGVGPDAETTQGASYRITPVRGPALGTITDLTLGGQHSDRIHVP